MYSPLLALIDLWTSIGGDDKVQVKIAKYEPDVKCDTSATPGPPFHSCFGIFSNMRANTRTRVFGDYDQPGVEEHLPYTLEAGKWEGPTQACGNISRNPPFPLWCSI